VCPPRCSAVDALLQDPPPPRVGPPLRSARGPARARVLDCGRRRAHAHVCDEARVGAAGACECASVCVCACVCACACARDCTCVRTFVAKLVAGQPVHVSVACACQASNSQSTILNPQSSVDPNPSTSSPSPHPTANSTHTSAARSLCLPSPSARTSTGTRYSTDGSSSRSRRVGTSTRRCRRGTLGSRTCSTYTCATSQRCVRGRSDVDTEASGRVP
jgi:hypothetical protein